MECGTESAADFQPRYYCCRIVSAQGSFVIRRTALRSSHGSISCCTRCDRAMCSFDEVQRVAVQARFS